MCHDVLIIIELHIEAACFMYFHVISIKEPSNIMTNGKVPLWETVLKLFETSVLQIFVLSDVDDADS